MLILQPARRLLSRFGRARQGAIAVEFAFTFPLFLAMRQRRLTESARAAS